MLLQRLDTDRATVNDPVIAEIAEHHRLCAVLHGRHIVGDNYGLAENGVVGRIPQVISGGVLECTQRQCRFVVHQPYGVFTILRIERMVQPENIVKGKHGSGDPRLCTCSIVQNAGRHMFARTEYKTFVLGFSEILRKTVSQIVFKAECSVMYKIIVQFNEHCQLVGIHGMAGKVIHTVLKRNTAALRHPCGNVGAVLGKDTACTVIGFYDRGHAAKQAFLRNCFLEFFVATGGQCISAGNAV